MRERACLEKQRREEGRRDEKEGRREGRIEGGSSSQILVDPPDIAFFRIRTSSSTRI